MSEKSILLRLEEQGHSAPRVHLKGGTSRAKGVERYEILGEVARGGVGVVYRGHDNDLGRDVALKVLREDRLDIREIVERFVEEAQIGGQLQHPGIVPVYELGLRGDERPYFAMKLIKGETLSARLAARGDPAEDRQALLAVFREACRTVAYAHSRGVVHRDLKPSNVMIGQYGEVQVVDWGFAKVLKRGGVDDERLARKAERDRTMISTVRTGEGGDASVAGSVMGTPAYMPPEQALGRVEDLDEKSDLFSLGAILCEILTGKPPYLGNDADRLTAAARAQLDDAHERLAACGADAKLVALCRQCLEPLPKDRPASADVLAEQVADHLARAESRAHRAEVRALQSKGRAEARTRARRRTGLVAGGAVAVLLAALGVYLFLDGERRAREGERERAVQEALQDAERLRGARQWQQALAAVDRANALGHASDLASEIRAEATGEAERLEREERERALMADLEEVRDAMVEPGARDAPTVIAGGIEIVGIAWRDARYRKTLAAHGVVLDAGAEEVTPTLRSRFPGALSRIADALDCWALRLRFRREAGEADGTDPELLMQVSRAIAPGAGRDLLHAAWRADDGGPLRRLAEDTRLAERDPTYLANLGISLLATDEPTLALRVLERGASSYPGDAHLHSWLSIALRQEETPRPEEILLHETIALALRPSPQAWRNFASAHWSAGHVREAVAAARRAAALRDDLADYKLLLAGYLSRLDREEAAEALAVLERAVAQEAACADSLAEVGVPRVRALITLERWDDAEAEVRPLIDRWPEVPGIRVFLGQILEFGHGRLVEAAEQYREALRRMPEFAVAHYFLGHALEGLGRPAEAEAEYRKALERHPTWVEGCAGLALLLARQGRWSEVEELSRRSLQDAARDPYLSEPVRSERVMLSELHACLGQALRVMGREAEGYEHLEMAVDIEPSNPQARNNLATAMVDRGDLDAAEAMLREARRVADMGSPAMASSALGNLVWVLAAKRNAARRSERTPLEDEILGLAREALRQEPGEAVAVFNLLLSLVQYGRYEEAVRVGEEAPPLPPDSPYALYIPGLLESARRYVAADARLADWLSGRVEPASALERADLAVVLLARRPDLAARAAAELEEVLEAGLDLGGSIGQVDVLTLATEAALQAAFDPGCEVGERERWRRAALAWCRRGLEQDRHSHGLDMRWWGWLHGSLMAPVRDDQALARLPAGERKDWEALWHDVAAAGVLARARGLLATKVQAATQLWQQGRLEEAEAALRPLASEFPRIPQARQSRGGLLLALGRRAEALQVMREALDLYGAQVLDPRIQPTRYNAACCAVLLGGDASSEALHWLREDLDLWRRILACGDGASVITRLGHWTVDADLTSVRDAEDLPDAWKQLWADVAALLARARDAVGR